MKKIFLTSLCVLAMPVVADDAADSLKSRLHALQSFQANFSQQVVDGQGLQVQEATGKLQLQQPNKLRWELFAPHETLLIADGQAVWHVDPFVEQAIVLDQQTTVADNPLILLAQPDSQHWQDFAVTAEGASFQIRSQNQDSQIDTLTLKFDGKTLVSLSLLDRQQQTSTLDFSDIQQNATLPAELFRFALPDGYELDDQRQVQTGSLPKP